MTGVIIRGTLLADGTYIREIIPAPRLTEAELLAVMRKVWELLEGDEKDD